MSIEAFDYIKYIYIFFIIILFVLFVRTIFIKKQFNYINRFSIVSISIICTVVAFFSLILIGYASDEINLNAVSFTYMALIIVILAIINVIFSYRVK